MLLPAVAFSGDHSHSLIDGEAAGGNGDSAITRNRPTGDGDDVSLIGIAGGEHTCVSGAGIGSERSSAAGGVRVPVAVGIIPGGAIAGVVIVVEPIESSAADARA